MDDLLRQYIHATLQELRVDPKMMALLKGTDLRTMTGAGNKESQRVAEDWLDNLGGQVSPRDRNVVTRFVMRRWPGILHRYHGNAVQAQQTMYNLLDTRFHDLRVYER